MSASSSRIMIAPVDGSRPLSDRFIDRLLGWWDTGGGRHLRRAARTILLAAGARVRTIADPLLQRPLVAKLVAAGRSGLAATRRGLARAFANDVPPAVSRQPDADESPAPLAPATPAAPAGMNRSATAEIRTPIRSGTAEIRTPIRSGTAEFRPRTRPSITRPAVAPVTASEPAPTGMTTTLRCWSCLQRHRVRTPRRGGCFHCGQCDQTMLVVDPMIGLTCDVEHAAARGIPLNREADETDPAIGTRRHG